MLTGVKGERWPMVREAFLASYDPVSPVRPGEHGRYVKRPIVAHALRLPASLNVVIDGGTLHASLGDWLLQYPDGSHGVLSDEIFAATYEDA